MKKAKRIRVLELRKITLAKVEYQGSFQGIGAAYGKLMQWARSNGFSNPKTNKTLTIYHDDPNVVGMYNVRQSACIIANKPFEPTNEIKKTELNAGKCVVGRYEISFFEFKEAWLEMFDWIHKNNLKVSKKDAFEVYQNNSNTHPLKKTIIDICIPIE
ncbi:AraC family transcriptional regulator [Algibacter mikhailovii]|uniref:AraC effector-binding domain-containing protein n=1 Tax=Algibacter mikhailovii TaxID=425498 RepID=A0A918RC34_9FLAO|nr:GyrI-like domain-containing protein [Algibacter mikhailovii]GGZ89884.1 hypothetical protein GCM10007028_30240 [Algibacter mikhailovii]